MTQKASKTILTTILIILITIFFNTVQAAPMGSNPNWNIHLENIQITEGSITASTDPTIDESQIGLVYEICLDTPGQFYEFTVEVKNSGTIDAVLDEVVSTTLTDEQQKYLSYVITYYNGTSIQKNDQLNAGATEKIKVRIEFKKDINAEDLPNSDTKLNLALSLNYVGEDEEDVEPEQPDDSNSKGDSDDSKEADNSSKDKKAEPSNAQTGDNILICFALIGIATAVLIFARRKKDEQ